MAIVSINETTARGYYQVLSTEAKPVQAVQDGAMLRAWTSAGVND